MKFSIITVGFNCVDTIAKTLESVSAQTGVRLEHIIIDGASVDGTMEIVNKFNKGQLKVLSEPDHGIYDAMNKGLRLATGDVIGFLNADDTYAHSGVLERVSTLMQRQGVDAIYGDAEYVQRFDLSNPVRRYRSDRFEPARIGWGWMPAHPTLFLRRAVFDRYGVFRTDYRIAGDFELVARVFHANEVPYLYLPEVLVRMRIGGISTAGLSSTILLNQEVLRACRENGIATNWLKILWKYPTKIMEFLRK